MVFAVCNDRAGGFGSEDAAFGVEADQSAGEEAVGPDLARGQGVADLRANCVHADQPASDGVVTPDRRPADRVLDAGALGRVHADQPAQAAAVLSGAVAIGDLALETNMGDQAAVLADQTTDGGAVRAGNPARGAHLPDDAKVLADQSADGRALL